MAESDLVETKKRHKLSVFELKLIQNVKTYITELKNTVDSYCSKNNINLDEFPIKIVNINNEVSNICGVSSTTSKRCSEKLSQKQAQKENIPAKASTRPEIICDSFSIASIR